jgi:ATP-dependent RNA helicase DeaD
MNEENMTPTMNNESVQDENLQIEEPDNSLPLVKREDLPPRMLAATERAGWTTLTPVQSRAMPYLMAGRPIMVQARTGSGKTGAFIMPIMELVNQLQDETQALVLAPTRELALQIVKEAEMLLGDSGLRVTAVYGGVGYGAQLKALEAGTHLVVGTPGRVIDHLQRRSLSLDKLKVLVFDEADRMLSMGFYPDMRRIQEYLPQNIYTCMFSATFPQTVRSLARQFMDQPEFLGLSADHVHVTDTAHQMMLLPPLDKDRILIRVIEFENPDAALIFCNTRQRVHYVATVLQRFGYNADEISGDLSQNERERVMKKLREGKLRFLVATDVAARGIDISELSHVFQYEVPEDPEIYIHRAGRTGRAGATGVAITLVGKVTEEMLIRRISRQYDIEFEELPVPDEEAVSALVAERTIVRLEATMKERDKLRIERMERFLPVVEEMAGEEHGRRLLAMLLDDYYHESLHAPPPGVSVPEPRKQQNEKKKRRRRRRSSR